MALAAKTFAGQSVSQLVQNLCQGEDQAQPNPVLARKNKEKPRPGRPPLIDSCHAFKSDGEVVKNSWPDHYTGE